ncbi:MAG: DUF4251 domain-containing protein [Bacteroidaceae bacterium]|nr:DUF4251 domain-containing protein [Bacteroidaceae bacterium]
MKKVLILASTTWLLLSATTFAQTSRSEREQRWRTEREQRRAQAKALELQQDSTAFVQALKALKTDSWVLEANNVNFSNGITRFVSPSTNYISYDDDEGTIQTAFSNFTYSPNGLGGVTVQGTISGQRMSTDRDGNVYYSFNIQGSTISAIVSLTLTAGTNQASATITPNFAGNTMTFDGYLVPYDQSSIFQGMPQW